MSEPIHIISLGAGVQSSTVDKISRKGGFGLHPVASIFADTKDEPSSVYAWLEELKQAQGHPILTVNKGCLMCDALKIATSKKSGMRYLKGLIPAYLKNPDGSKALMGRKCTGTYKIDPIVSEARELVGQGVLAEWRARHKSAIKAINDARKEKTFVPMKEWNELQDDALVAMQIGISTDESDRMKPSKTMWIRSEWPLIKHGMSRSDCQAELKKMTGKTAPRSACKKCPFHSDEEWMLQKTNHPDEFSESVKFEMDMQEAARNQQALIGVPFLHESLQPLDKVDFENRPSHAQLSLFSNECEGLCGV